MTLALASCGDARLWLETVPLCMLFFQCLAALVVPDICWRSDATATMPAISTDPKAPRCRHPTLQRLLGSWRLQDKDNMDAFLEGMGFPPIARAFLVKAGQQQVIRYIEEGDKVNIRSSDMRGTSALELPLSGKGVVANDGDNGSTVCRSAAIDKGAGAVVITERFSSEREPLSVCSRTLLPDGRMCIDIRKRNDDGRYFNMKAIYVREIDV